MNPADLDLRQPDDRAAWWQWVRDVNATPVPLLIGRSKPVRHDSRARPVVTAAGHRAAFISGPPPTRCCRPRAHDPHLFGLNSDRSCDGAGMPRQREDIRGAA